MGRGWPFGARGAKAGAAGWVHGLLQARFGSPLTYRMSCCNLLYKVTLSARTNLGFPSLGFEISGFGVWSIGLMARYNEGLGFRGSQDWGFVIRECRASECLGF